MVEYAHAVMNAVLPDGNAKLPPESCLQYPGDYLDVLKIGIPKLLESADVTKEQVTGIQVGFVSCGVMPVDKEGTPLCFYEKFKNWPYTYIELWKHQGIHHEVERFHKAVNRFRWSFLGRLFNP